MLPPLIVILGPTAIGKTELSLSLCEQFNGEVISADSRQIYRGMDIGTAKATPAEQARIPHHLIDIREPDQVLTVAEYQQLAYAAIDALQQRQKIPFLVGGTALYLRAVVEGLQIPEVPPNPELRAELEARLAAEGVEALFRYLQQLDPLAAAHIDGRNPRRVLRALEIILITGRSKMELEGANPPPYRILQIGLTRSRESLYQRVDQRVDQMVEQGLLTETERLLELGYPITLPAMTSLGYRQAVDYLQGKRPLAETVSAIKIETHRFVRHQYTWFRRMPTVQWFDLDTCTPSEIVHTVETFTTSSPIL